MADKPTGTFQCAACKDLWDGSELFDDPLRTAITWTCGDLTCGALVYRISDDPKATYLQRKRRLQSQNTGKAT